MGKLAALAALIDAGATPATDDAIPAFLKRPPDGRKAAEIARDAEAAARGLPRAPLLGEAAPAAVIRLHDDAALRREADRLWRNWTPSGRQTTRPQLRTILRDLREQAGETMKPVGPKGAQLRALRTASASASESAKPQVAKATAHEPKAKPEAKTQESDVKRTTAKTTKSKARTAVQGKTKTKPKGESKVALIAGLLQRKEGCTTADVLKATGWPAVSMPQQARAAGLKLKKVKDGKASRYYAA